MRKIIHIDMDAFYASVEQRDRPELKGKPIVVGGQPHSRGVVASASYEARKYGIRSAMSCAKAYRLCPQTIFVPPQFEKYLEASRKIREIFLEVTPLVEPLSLDEAYLDVTQNLLGEPLAKNIAKWIQEKIQKNLGLTASAGVGPNKFIAKIASDLRKPNGLVVIPPEKVFSFIASLPIEKLWGVGPATAKKLHSVNIRTTEDIRKFKVQDLERWVGSYGVFLYGLAHGQDDREVDPSSDPKSRGTETTFDKDILDPQVLFEYIDDLSEELSCDLKKTELPGKTVTLKIKYHDFKSITRSQTLSFPTSDAATIAKTAKELLFRDTETGKRAIRLLGVSVSNLVGPEDPLQLWFDFKE